jgi:hypothetical protein
MQLAGAFEAESLVFRFVVFNAGDENHRHVFAAAGTESRLHGFDFPPWETLDADANRQDVEFEKNVRNNVALERIAADERAGKLQKPAQERAVGRAV